MAKMLAGSIKNSGPTPRPRFNGKRPNATKLRAGDRRFRRLGTTVAPAISVDRITNVNG